MTDSYIDTPIFELIKIVTQNSDNVKIQHVRSNPAKEQIHDIIPANTFCLLFKSIPGTNLYYSQGFIVEFNEDHVYFTRSINGIPFNTPIKVSKQNFKWQCSNLEYMKSKFKNFPDALEKSQRIAITAGKKYSLKVQGVRGNQVILISNDASHTRSFTFDQRFTLQIITKIQKPFLNLIINLEGEDAKGNFHFHSTRFASPLVDIVFPKKDIASFIHLP